MKTGALTRSSEFFSFEVPRNVHGDPLASPTHVYRSCLELTKKLFSSQETLLNSRKRKESQGAEFIRNLPDFLLCEFLLDPADGERTRDFQKIKLNK